MSWITYLDIFGFGLGLLIDPLEDVRLDVAEAKGLNPVNGRQVVPESCQILGELFPFGVCQGDVTLATDDRVRIIWCSSRLALRPSLRLRVDCHADFGNVRRRDCHVQVVNSISVCREKN